MSKVHVSLRREDGTPTRAPISGAIRFSPTKRRTAGPDVILPAAFDAQLVDGEVVVELAATGPEWCWMVIEPTGVGIIRHIIVPDVEPSVVLEYSMLPDVDPATLEPSAEPEAAWWLALQEVSAPDPEAVGSAVDAYLTANPPTGVGEAELSAAITAHVEAEFPHPAYDEDLPSLALIFENHII